MVLRFLLAGSLASKLTGDNLDDRAWRIDKSFPGTAERETCDYYGTINSILAVPAGAFQTFTC